MTYEIRSVATAHAPMAGWAILKWLPRILDVEQVQYLIDNQSAELIKPVDQAAAVTVISTPVRFVKWPFAGVPTAVPIVQLDACELLMSATALQ